MKALQGFEREAQRARCVRLPDPTPGVAEYAVTMPETGIISIGVVAQRRGGWWRAYGPEGSLGAFHSTRRSAIAALLRDRAMT